MDKQVEARRHSYLENLRTTVGGPSYLLPHIRKYRTSRSDGERQELFLKVAAQARKSEEEVRKELVARARQDQRIIQAEARGWIYCLVSQGVLDADHAGAELTNWLPGAKYNP